MKNKIDLNKPIRFTSNKKPVLIAKIHYESNSITDIQGRVICLIRGMSLFNHEVVHVENVPEDVVKYFPITFGNWDKPVVHHSRSPRVRAANCPYYLKATITENGNKTLELLTQDEYAKILKE